MSTATKSRPTPKIKTPVRISSKARRRQILEVASRMIEVKGFEAVSGRKLAKAANISDTLIFRHFGTMNGLFENVCKKFIQDMVTIPFDPDNDSDRDFIFELAYRLLEHNRENPRSLRLLTWAELQIPEMVMDIRNKMMNSGPFLELKYRLQSYFDDEEQVEVFIRIFFNSVMSELKHHLVHKRGKSMLNSRSYAQNLTQFLTYGLMMRL